MNDTVYWVLLVLGCTPIYLFIAWAFFDTVDNARDSFFEAIIPILKKIFIPDIIAAFMGRDDVTSLSIWVVGLYFAGCIALTWAIHLGIQKLFG
jgi:hypothetical protein